MPDEPVATAARRTLGAGTARVWAASFARRVKPGGTAPGVEARAPVMPRMSRRDGRRARRHRRAVREAKEHLAGGFVIDCDSLERAAEIAARFPDARFSAVEVRPIVTG